jgi:hypothetical protein
MPKKEKEKTSHHTAVRHSPRVPAHHDAMREDTAAPEAQAEPTPQAVSAPPPHPGMNVFRVLKQSFREYHSGPGATFTVATPAGQAHTATLAISGTIDVDPTVLTLPPTVSVSVNQGGAVVATRAAPVTPGSPGTYTTTFPANTLVAGAATATGSSTVPLKTATTPPFTLT